MKVKIIGAGSIGNHLAHGCRREGFDVAICDLDAAALERTKSDIYPSRYGQWDTSIRLGQPGDFHGESFDITIVGTPPDTHSNIALSELHAENPPKVLAVEKPLCRPDLAECEEIRRASEKSATRLLVGYNHRTTPHTLKAAELIASGDFGKPLLLNGGFQEYWGGIFKAHPWLTGPSDTYLGFTERGGGAGGEHSHGINIWSYFAELCGAGRVIEVTGQVEIVKDGSANYDRVFHLHLRTEQGLHGVLLQDVVTEPSRKWLRLQFSEGFIGWEVNSRPGADGLSWQSASGSESVEFPKTRPDDFANEIRHLGQVAANPSLPSPLDFSHGLETMLILIAGHQSAQAGRRVIIDRSESDLVKTLKF